MKKKFRSWCCQECGEHIGWLGRLIKLMLPQWHTCKDEYSRPENWGHH